MAKRLTQLQRWIKKALLSRDMSQTLIAKEVGINQATISRKL